ncbi:MAG: SLBB domain-containing protein [Phormidesmis sp.]
MPAAKAQRSEGLPSLSTEPIPTVPTPTQTVAPSPPIPESSYTLGPGDIVNVEIFQVSQYSGSSQVLIDGTLNLPLAGRVNVNGLTLEAASELISSRYGQYLKRPIITLSLSERRPLQIGIAGEIGRPGSYTIEQNNTQSARLSQLIETAGGISQAADLSRIQVSRPQINGEPKILTVNLLALIKDGDLTQDLTLRDGDSVFVPTSQVPLENSALIADASFASDANQPINIAIIGEVYRPGPYTLEGNSGGSNANNPTTITNAIQVAGGIKPQADIRKVQVVRPTRSGTPQVFEADLWQLINAGDLQQDAILQAGDTVFVPVATALTPAEVSQVASASFSPDTIRVNVVGEVENSGVIELPPNTPLSQAILAAGGFDNTRANRGSAELVRLNDDGTVNRETISVDFAQGIDEETNPLLRNNDVVIVNRNGLTSATDVLRTITSPFGGIFSIFRFLDIFD